MCVSERVNGMQLCVVGVRVRSVSEKKEDKNVVYNNKICPFNAIHPSIQPSIGYISGKHTHTDRDHMLFCVVLTAWLLSVYGIAAYASLHPFFLF